jgi:integrase
MISDATFGVALRSMGIPQDMMSAHGFRSMASSLLNEAGFNPDVIERQLAHAGKNQIREIYNRTEYWQERVQLMQAWADMVDDLAMHAAP